MDKAMMLLGLILIATPLVVLTLGIGWLMDDFDDFESNIEGQHNTDSDIHSDVCTRHRRRGGDSVPHKRMDAEEVINGLQDLRMALSRTEKEWLDYACDCVLRLEQLQKIVSEVKNNDNNN